jgi:hypothetical protein
MSNATHHRLDADEIAYRRQYDRLRRRIQRAGCALRTNHRTGAAFVIDPNANCVVAGNESTTLDDLEAGGW